MVDHPSDGLILVVDDDVALQKLIVKTLNRHEYNVIGAISGHEAIEIIKRREVCLLLIDQTMSDYNGFDIIKMLKSDGISVDFIMLTGQGDERLAVDIMKLGARDYLVKDTGLLELLPEILKKTLRTIQNEKKLKVSEERHKDLTAQLYQTQKMESIGRLAGGIAHDFNNMLSAINSAVQIAISKTDETDEIRNYLNVIRNASKRSGELTKKLLSFAKEQPIEPQILDINITIEHAIELLNMIIGDNINLDFIADKSIGFVRADPGQLEQILTNLCINARDAIGDRDGSIVIGTLQETFDKEFCRHNPEYNVGDFINIYIKDTGGGINPDILPHIFEPFYTTKSKEKGTGLGLASVYGMVKQNGGFIVVESKEGAGSTFKIYLPISEKQDVKKRIPKRRKDNKNDNIIIRDITVLLVESESIIMDMTSQALEALNLRVLKALTPDDALDIVKNYSKKIDLLITDIGLKGMDGYELAGNIKSMIPEIKLLFITGCNNSITKKIKESDSGDLYIEKPFSLSDFTLKVKELLTIS